MPICSNNGRSESTDGSRCVNLFPEVVTDTEKGQTVVLYGTPGTTLFATLPTFPVLAMIEMGGKFYVVTASRFYCVEWYGAYVDLGQVTMIGSRVSMATNGLQIVFVDGVNGYYYSPSLGLHAFSEPGWYPANTVTVKDGYFIFNRAGTGQFFITKLLDITFDATMWATAESAPDNTECVISNSQYLLILGKESGEFWYDSGDALFPFEKIPGTDFKTGILAPHTAAVIDNSVFWLGSDGVVYRTEGYSSVRVSTHGIESNLNTPFISDAFAYTYSEEGHRFYVLTIPSKQLTFVYDLITGMWHERSHFRFGRHISNCFCRLSTYGLNLVGDFQNGNIYLMSLNSHTDDGTPIKRTAVFPQIHAGDPGVTMYSFEIEAAHPDQLDIEPQMMLQFSDDNKKTWSKERWKSMGRLGQYKKQMKWGPLGFFQKRNMRLTITDPIKVVITGAFAEYG